MDPLALGIINGYQRGLPLTPRPYRAIAEQLGSTEDEIIERLTALSHSGAISRVGAVFAPGRIGAGTLAALSVPAARLAEVAAQVNAHPEVNHNYEREHACNLWFVVTAPDQARVRCTAAEIESQAGCGKMLYLPMMEGYHIDLGFPLGAVAPRPARPVGQRQVRLSARERALAAALQEGLDLVAEPYTALAVRAGITEREVVATLGQWLEAGIVKRLGLVVRHHELGYGANAMVVWDAPDGQVAQYGRRVAALPYVTLCYRRARCLPEWRYNLYCMIHGRNREEVSRQIDAVNTSCGLSGLSSAVLFSRRRFKQVAARYIEAEAAEAAHG